MASFYPSGPFLAHLSLNFLAAKQKKFRVIKKEKKKSLTIHGSSTLILETSLDPSGDSEGSDLINAQEIAMGICGGSMAWDLE